MRCIDVKHYVIENEDGTGYWLVVSIYGSVL